MTHWRIMLNSKLWNQTTFADQWKKGERHTLAQSKGGARMVTLPSRGDSVVFVCKGHVVMRGTVSSDGFVEGTAHQNDQNNQGQARPHAETNQFAWILINEVLLEPRAVPHTGQRTWLKVEKDEVWA
jgi:hypothetical protein